MTGHKDTNMLLKISLFQKSLVLLGCFVFFVHLPYSAVVIALVWKGRYADLVHGTCENRLYIRYFAVGYLLLRNKTDSSQSVW